jgi:YggT family protein
MRYIAFSVLNLIFDVAYILVIIRAFLSYVPHNKENKLIRPIYLVTDHLIGYIQRGLPPAWLGFDASAIIAILLIYLLQQIIYYFISLI